MKPTNQQWKAFAERIIEKKGNPSVKDAKECGIPVGYFNELCMRNLSSEQLVKNAELTLSKIGGNANEQREINQTVSKCY